MTWWPKALRQSIRIFMCSTINQCFLFYLVFFLSVSLGTVESLSNIWSHYNSISFFCDGWLSCYPESQRHVCKVVNGDKAFLERLKKWALMISEIKYKKYKIQKKNHKSQTKLKPKKQKYKPKRKGTNQDWRGEQKPEWHNEEMKQEQ